VRRASGMRGVADGSVERGDIVADEAVVDAGAVAAGGQEPDGVQDAQLGGGVADREPGGPGEVLDAALGLGEQVGEFPAARPGDASSA
jgi:hypothetical protein